MINLLCVELTAMKRWRAIWISLIFVVFISMFGACMNVNNKFPALDGIFAFSYVVLMIMSAISGLFIYRDYSQNTIRNKIVSGHGRASVYFSKAISVLLLYLVTIVLFMITFMTVAVVYSEIDYIVWDKFWQNVFMVLASTVTLSAITTLISVNIKSALGAILPVMLLGSFMFIGTIAFELATLNNNEQLIFTMETLPIICMLTLHETKMPTDLFLTVWYSFGFTVGLLGVGYAAFRKSDLK